MGRWTDEKEIEYIRNKLPKDEKSIVFSHNDLLANNVLLNDAKKFFFIDFEYSCFNYRTYDLANYLLESIFNYDVTEPPYFSLNKEPISIELIEDVMRHYALRYLYDMSEEEEEKVVND